MESNVCSSRRVLLMPGAMWDLGHFMAYANLYGEIGPENRPEGNRLVLRIMWRGGVKGLS
jgi:hypothetical protein